MIWLIVAGVALRTLLVVFSTAPYGYVWDFYYEGVQRLYGSGRLPASPDCWQCYHPPLFYLLGLPFYAIGRWLSPGGDDAMALRWLGGLSLVCGAIVVYYGDRLLRFFGCRGASRVTGFALLIAFPCLFISSYGPEADIVVAAVMSALIFHLTRYFAHPKPSGVLDAARLGLLAGLAAATKYSGLVGVASVATVTGIRALTGPERVRAVRDMTIVIVICAVVGGWKYLDNVRRFGTPLFANGAAAQGFTAAGRQTFPDHYEFFTIRIPQLMEIVGRGLPPRPLTDFPVYRSVITTLHGLAWSDMSFFSDPSRHGDPTRPYPLKRTQPAITRAVLLLGFVPDFLAVAGFIRTLRRRVFWPIAIVSVLGIALYVAWFLTQEAWGLKTKYLLFLLPPFVVYAVAGLAWIWRRAPAIAGDAVGWLLVTLVLLVHIYLFVFSVG